jgi:ectoine hydroxylase-related dioxygenase (phytanoyl-CoA dioxygenase family)
VPAPLRATKGEKDPGGHLGAIHGTNARQADMSGHVRVSRQAGGAVVFDTRTWHAVFPNIGGRDRRSLTLRCGGRLAPPRGGASLAPPRRVENSE